MNYFLEKAADPFFVKNTVEFKEHKKLIVKVPLDNLSTSTNPLKVLKKTRPGENRNNKEKSYFDKLPAS